MLKKPPLRSFKFKFIKINITFLALLFNTVYLILKLTGRDHEKKNNEKLQNQIRHT